MRTGGAWVLTLEHRAGPAWATSAFFHTWKKTPTLSVLRCLPPLLFPAESNPNQHFYLSSLIFTFQLQTTHSWVLLLCIKL